MRVKLSWGANTISLDFPEKNEVTVKAALKSVGSLKPDAFKSWCDKEGNLRKSLSVFVNRTHIRYLSSFETILKDGDRLHLVPLITGG